MRLASIMFEISKALSKYQRNGLLYFIIYTYYYVFYIVQFITTVNDNKGRCEL